MKVVVNRCYGGFGLSDEAEDLYAELSGFEIYRYSSDDIGDDAVYTKNKKGFISFTFKKDYGDKFVGFPEGEDSGYWYSSDTKRDDELLVQVVERLGAKANGSFAKLEVVEIPDNVCWEINEYDGYESVEECHRSW